MRAIMLSRLPKDLTGARVLDAGCGTGAMTEELARRGARVTAIDISPQLVEIAERRIPEALHGQIEFTSGDMLSPDLGRFDHVMAMDSMIYYTDDDLGQALAGLSARVSTSIVFTVAPRTPFLMAFFTVGKLFPRSDRSPTMIPHSPRRIARKKRLCTAEQAPFPRSSASAADSISRPVWSTAYEPAQAHIDQVSALRGRGQRRLSVEPASAPQPVPGLGRHGRRDAARHPEPRDDRGASGLGLPRGRDGGAAGADRAVPRAPWASSPTPTNPPSDGSASPISGSERSGSSEVLRSCQPRCWCWAATVTQVRYDIPLCRRGAGRVGLPDDRDRHAHDPDRGSGAGCGPRDG